MTRKPQSRALCRSGERPVALGALKRRTHGARPRGACRLCGRLGHVPGLSHGCRFPAGRLRPTRTPSRSQAARPPPPRRRRRRRHCRCTAAGRPSRGAPLEPGGYFRPLHWRVIFGRFTGGWFWASSTEGDFRPPRPETRAGRPRPPPPPPGPDIALSGSLRVWSRRARPGPVSRSDRRPGPGRVARHSPIQALQPLPRAGPPDSNSGCSKSGIKS